MIRIKFLIVLLFIAALGAGFLVGQGVARTKSVADTHPGERTVGNGSGRHPTTRPSLTEALALTPAQSEQLKAIWSDWDTSRQSRFERHPQFQKERDDAIQALLSESQKTVFDDIQKKYRQQLDQLDEERRQVYQAAVDKTKAILNDKQRAEYEEMLKNAPLGRGPRGGDRNRGPASRRSPASQPGQSLAPGSAGGSVGTNAGG
ncbi:MAG: hypothetical protein FWD61_02630 [Phycisphaerales bacterium]|nr:hypothetical protein [Phycisphaerales bacterium]